MPPLTNQPPPPDPAAAYPALVRFSNRLLLFLAALALLMGGLNVRLEMLTGQPVWRSKICAGMLLVSLGFVAARFLLKPAARLNLLLLLAAAMFVELLLQAAAWLGVLPVVNTKNGEPWARVYWTAEGRGNSIRNRYGRYYPEFDLRKSNRLAIIGDSFVEGVEVHRSRNAGVVLGEKLSARWPDTAVYAFGHHGTGPAQYLEELKYAHAQFHIREAVIVIYLGNDLTDLSPAMRMHDATDFIYYQLGPDGALVLTPEAGRARAAYAGALLGAHRSPWLYLPRLASSHCMTVQLALSFRNTVALRERARREAEKVTGPEADLARLGLKAEPFAVDPSPEAKEAAAILRALVLRYRDFCAENAIKLRLVTIPFFPPDFYTQTDRRNWTAHLGGFDFLQPERELAAFAAEQKIPLLPLGEWMRRKLPDTEAVRALYLSNGSGHFTEAGHRFLAEGLEEFFYRGNPPTR